MTGVHVFSESSELGAIYTPPLFRGQGRGRIRLSGRLAKHPDSAEWERLLNRYYFACGCDIGAKGTVIGFIAAALLIYDSVTRGWFGWTMLAILSLGIIVVTSVVGKLAGLLQARGRLHELIFHIRREVPPTPPSADAQPIYCG